MLPTVITPRPAARFLAAGLLLASALAAAQPKAEAPKAKGPSSFEPPEPFVPVSAFRVPDDLEVTLWARTPLFRNPANIDIDAQGRIWIAESYNYRRHAGKDPAGKDLDLFVLGLKGKFDPSVYTQWFTTSQIGLRNWQRWSNPELDKTLAEALRTVDDKKRLGLLQNAAKIAVDDAALVPYVLVAVTEQV